MPTDPKNRPSTNTADEVDTDVHQPDPQLVRKVAERWFASAQDNWEGIGVDNAEKLQKAVDQVLRCLSEVLHDVVEQSHHGQHRARRDHR